MLNTIEEGIAAIRNGEMIIVVDDESRENEGDLVMAAKFATPEAVNFMAKEGRGLICVALTEKRCQELELTPMVSANTSLHETAFTVSVDLLSPETTTGISASDRSKTIFSLIDPSTKPEDLARPGHIFPLIAKEGGVLRRTGHTEASVDLPRLAGLPSAGVLVEVMNDDGTMARLPELLAIAEKFKLKIVAIKDLIEYRLQTDSLIEEVVRVEMPTKHGHFKLVAFRDKTSNFEHLALIKGTWDKDEPVLTRVHSSCFTGDILGSFRCDCGDQLHLAMQKIESEGKGVILYMNQEGRGIGLLNKLKAYKLQEEGMDTVDANIHLGFAMDGRDYGVGAQMLRSLGVSKLKLMSNNPRKRAALKGYGLEIVETVPIEITPNEFNEKYLTTKRDKLGHEILR